MNLATVVGEIARVVLMRLLEAAIKCFKMRCWLAKSSLHSPTRDVLCMLRFTPSLVFEYKPSGLYTYIHRCQRHALLVHAQASERHGQVPHILVAATRAWDSNEQQSDRLPSWLRLMLYCVT
jgi:hypothetical protein